MCVPAIWLLVRTVFMLFPQSLKSLRLLLDNKEGRHAHRFVLTDVYFHQAVLFCALKVESTSLIYALKLFTLTLNILLLCSL